MDPRSGHAFISMDHLLLQYMPDPVQPYYMAWLTPLYMQSHTQHAYSCQCSCPHLINVCTVPNLAAPVPALLCTNGWDHSCATQWISTSGLGPLHNPAPARQTTYQHPQPGTISRHALSACGTPECIQHPWTCTLPHRRATHKGASHVSAAPQPHPT